MNKIYVKEKITSIKPYIKNAKKSKNIELVKKSIGKLEYITPIIVDENNEILAGHSRYFALKELGYKEIEVLKIEGMSEENKRQFRIIDNKTTEYNDWDMELLRDEIKDLDLDFMQNFFTIDLKAFTINLKDTKVNEITMDDIQKSEQNLYNFTDNIKKEQTEITCPYCLKKFSI